MIVIDYVSSDARQSERDKAVEKYRSEVMETVGKDILFRADSVRFRMGKVIKIENNMIELQIPTVSAFGPEPHEIYCMNDIRLATL